jgi:hypothetical protein
MNNSHFKMMFISCFGWDYKLGASELGLSERQIRRYIKGHPVSPPVYKLMSIIHRGYLPNDGAWGECRIYRDGTMETPWGKVSPSDVQLVHRYKWSARKAENRYKALKKKHEESDAYMSDLQDKLLDIVGDLSAFYGT